MQVKLHLICIILFLLSGADLLYAQAIEYDLVIRPASCNDMHDGKAEVNITSLLNPPYTFLWNFGGTTNSVRGLPPGDYTVIVTDAAGSDTTINIEVPSGGGLCRISPEIVFTPNGDGYNDSWYIDNIEFHPYNLVQVFNRWGQKVFEHSGTYEPWDGKDLLGIPVPENAYYYIVYGNKNDENTIVKGCVSVVR